jgi:AraC family transcriptional activator of pyochelin receptor
MNRQVDGILKTATSIQTSNGYIDPFKDAANAADRFETCWHVSKEIGHGFFRKIEFQSGFDLYVMDCRFNGSSVFRATASPSVVCIRFNLSGQNTVKIHGLNKTFSTTAQKNSLFYFSNPETSGYLPENQHMRGVSIHFEPGLFLSLLDEEALSLPGIRHIAKGKDIPYFFHTGTTSPDMQMTVHQIVNCPYHGLIRKLFLEGKALELLSYKLGQIEISGKQAQRNNVCRLDDVERIRHAGNILIENMETPPSLADLGKAVGFSRTKLHVEFCKHYGVTPFAYLRNARLNRAKLLLDEGVMNVTEAAMTVGYASLSHFAKAFRRHFGVAPGDYLDNVITVRHQRP